MTTVLDDTEREQLDLHAPYQRESVWTIDQQRQLIRSFLERLPIAAIVLSDLGVYSDIHYRVVDGKQRIEALRAFARGNLAVPAHWWASVDLDTVHHDSDGNAMVDWHDLSDKGRRSFRNNTIAVVEFNGRHLMKRRADGSFDKNQAPLSDDELLAVEAEIYLRLNSAGTAHSDADLEVAKKLVGR